MVERITLYFGAALVSPKPTCRSARSPRPKIVDAPKVRIDWTEFDPLNVTSLMVVFCRKFCCRIPRNVVSGLVARKAPVWKLIWSPGLI